MHAPARLRNRANALCPRSPRVRLWPALALLVFLGLPASFGRAQAQAQAARPAPQVPKPQAVPAPQAPAQLGQPDAAGQAAASEIRRQYGATYKTHIDAARKLVLASNHLPPPVLQYLAERLGRYADAQKKHLLTNAPKAYVKLVFPDAKTFARLRPNAQTGGWYMHYTRTLIASNLAYTLTHEFTHALYEADLAARRVGGLGYWFDEGLAAAFEDSVVDEDGKVIPVTSPRVNVLKRGIRKFKLEAMLHTTVASFQADWSLNYAAAGGFCRWLAETDKLRAFYDAWCAARAKDRTADPSGIETLTAVLGQPLDKTAKAFSSWVRRLKKAQPLNYQPSGVPKIGLKGSGVPAGLKVTRVEGPSKRAGIKRGDIVLEIAGLAVDNQSKLNQALARERRARRFLVVIWRGATVERITVKK